LFENIKWSLWLKKGVNNHTNLSLITYQKKKNKKIKRLYKVPRNKKPGAAQQSNKNVLDIEDNLHPSPVQPMMEPPPKMQRSGPAEFF
jgi:hypothetical protein